MKTKPMKPRRMFPCLVGGLLCGGSLAPAAVLIRVDVTNPAAVVFTATSNHSLVNDSSATVGEGVTLMGFLTVELADDIFDFATSSNLTPSGTAAPFNAFIVGFESLSGLDLNLWSTNPFRPTFDFSVGSPAFSGTAIIDLAMTSLPAVGATGNITVGDTTFGSGAVLGQWVAIPEPTTPILILGAGVLALGRRRREA